MTNGCILRVSSNELVAPHLKKVKYKLRQKTFANAVILVLILVSSKTELGHSKIKF